MSVLMGKDRDKHKFNFHPVSDLWIVKLLILDEHNQYGWERSSGGKYLDSCGLSVGEKHQTNCKERSKAANIEKYLQGSMSGSKYTDG